MPHWDNDGDETVICQKCAKIVKGSQVTWRPDITGHKGAGNVCDTCLARHAGAGTDAKEYDEPRGPVSLAQHCSEESGFPLGSRELTRYMNRHYGFG
jgi:hypothetical protein